MTSDCICEAEAQAGPEKDFADFFLVCKSPRTFFLGCRDVPTFFHDFLFSWRCRGIESVLHELEDLKMLAESRCVSLNFPTST